MLAYERLGSGEPLVLVHGIGHRRQAWYPVVDRLAEQREVILVDLPGHGESPAYQPDGRTPREILKQELTEFLDALGIDRPHVAGNSLGGLIALEQATEGLARSATALAPAGFWRNNLDFAYVRGLFATVVAFAGISQPLAPLLARTAVGRALLFAWLTAHPTRIDPEAALGDFRALLAARPALREIIASGYVFDGEIDRDIPITIAWGTKDRVLRPYQGRRARAGIPWAEHVELPDCGHVPMTDNPELVADVILRGSVSKPVEPDTELDRVG